MGRKGEHGIEEIVGIFIGVLVLVALIYLGILALISAVTSAINSFADSLDAFWATNETVIIALFVLLLIGVFIILSHRSSGSRH